MRYKFGRFLLIIGLIGVFLFLATDSAGDPVYSLFLLGMPLVIIGGTLMYRFRPQPQQSTRFRLFKRKKKE